MAEIPGQSPSFDNFSQDDLDFLAGIEAQMTQELAEKKEISLDSSIENFRDKTNILHYYFGMERRALIAEYLEDRSDANRTDNLERRERDTRDMFKNAIDIMLAIEESPLLHSSDGRPVTKESFVTILLAFADRSQSDMNIIETGRPLRLQAEDLHEKVANAFADPDQTVTRQRIIELFDEHAWNTVTRFLAFLEDRSA